MDVYEICICIQVRICKAAARWHVDLWLYGTNENLSRFYLNTVLFYLLKNGKKADDPLDRAR